MIVAVPDPIQTAFGHWYDHLIETYTEAMADAGYTPDRHWLPWENLRRDEKDLKEREKVIGIESFPGVMLFRKVTEGKLKYGVLFIVGETTNVGVNSLALRRAFDLVRELHETKADGDLTIKIVGPLFTGSQFSWYRTIRAWMPINDKKTKVELISGSENALTPIAENECSSEILGRLSSPSRVRQRTTIVSNQLLTKAALHFLKADFFSPLKIYAKITKLPPGIQDVAFLNESNTGFGNAELQKDTFIDLRYPMHISRLSAVVREENRKRDERLGLAPQGIRAGGADVVRDQVTVLGGNVTASLTDRIIGDAMAVIRRKEIRHVGIVATDSRDVVFLTHRLREECPNTRIFLTEADMLFVTPENRNDMRGVVITSTYPLYPPNQEWTGGDDRHFFAAQFILGCFNATCAQLGMDSKFREYRPPHAARVKGTDTVSQTPPIWITTVGENGRFVPLHIFTKICDRQLYVAKDAPIPRTKVSLPLMNSSRIAGNRIESHSRPRSGDVSATRAFFRRNIPRPIRSSTRPNRKAAQGPSSMRYPIARRMSPSGSVSIGPSRGSRYLPKRTHQKRHLAKPPGSPLRCTGHPPSIPKRESPMPNCSSPSRRFCISESFSFICGNSPSPRFTRCFCCYSLRRSTRSSRRAGLCR